MLKKRNNFDSSTLQKIFKSFVTFKYKKIRKIKESVSINDQKNKNRIKLIDIYPEHIVNYENAKTIHNEIDKDLIERQAKVKNSYVAVIDNGYVYSSFGFILTADNKLIEDLSFELVADDPKKHHVFSINDLLVTNVTKENIAVLASCASDRNYYHWLIETLPRLDLLNRCNIHIDKYFVPYHHSFQIETLNILGIPDSKILKADKKTFIRAKNLIVPSLLCDYTRIKEKNNFGQPKYIYKWICSFLRNSLMPDNFSEEYNYKRIFISRQNAAVRKIENEKEVNDFLSKYGFEKVILEDMSVIEQISLFNSAEVIVSPHGAGLANLVFCKPKCKVIELFSPNYILNFFWLLSGNVGLVYYYLICDGGNSSNPVKENMRININMLNETLKFAEIE